MTTSITFPSNLPLPTSTPTGTSENTLRRTEMELGPARQRRRFRTAPRLWDLTWEFTADQFDVFEIFFEQTINGGDTTYLQPLADDDDSQILNYEVLWMPGSYRFAVSDTNPNNFVVSGTVRVLSTGVLITAPISIDLYARGKTKAIAQGTLTVGQYLYANDTVDTTAIGVINQPLYSDDSVDTTATGMFA